MTTGDIHAAQDEAWGRGLGTACTFEHAAMLAAAIETNLELLGKPDGFFGSRAQQMRARMERECREFGETLERLMEGMRDAE